MRFALAFAVLASLVGCSRENACKRGSVLVAYTLVAGAAAAEQLEVDVAIDGAASRQSVVSPRGAAGTIEIDFPAGYPAGHRLTVTLVALVSGNAIGSGSADLVLGTGCGNVAVDVGAATSGSDLADGTAFDLAGADLLGGDDLATCNEGTTRCNQNTVQTCTSGTWHDTSTCTSYCAAGACVTPASCNGLATTCGAAGNGVCCAASLVAGGTYDRSYDAVTYTDNSFKASVSPFIMDDYEVTVGRFRRFYNAYPASKPAAGSGKNPKNPADTGWDASWDGSLPTDQAALATELGCTGGTWTATAGANEERPVNCIDWYTAYAFCIWDGGRLPTEAEWDLAAQCGAMQRVYPWSNPSTATTIDGTYLVYGGAAIAPVGSLPKGNGCFGQSDLSGNVFEWAQDWYASPYPTSTCNDCANLSASTLRVLRGGSYANGASFVLGAARNDNVPTFRDATVGIRCVRQP